MLFPCSDNAAMLSKNKPHFWQKQNDRSTLLKILKATPPCNFFDNLIQSGHITIFVLLFPFHILLCGSGQIVDLLWLPVHCLPCC